MNGSIAEKHAKKQDSKKLENIFKDKNPHLFTLIVNPDNTFQIYLDKEVSIVVKYYRFIKKWKLLRVGLKTRQPHLRNLKIFFGPIANDFCQQKD